MRIKVMIRGGGADCRRGRRTTPSRRDDNPTGEQNRRRRIGRRKMNEERQLPESVRRGARGGPRRPAATPRCTATITGRRPRRRGQLQSPTVRGAVDLLASDARRRLKIAAVEWRRGRQMTTESARPRGAIGRRQAETHNARRSSSQNNRRTHATNCNDL